MKEHNAPINVNPLRGGGGCASKGWGFGQKVKILVNFLRVGKDAITKCT